MTWKSVALTILSVLFLALYYPLVGLAYVLWGIFSLLYLLAAPFMKLGLGVLNLALWPLNFLARYEVCSSSICLNTSGCILMSSTDSFPIPSYGCTYWCHIRVSHVLHLYYSCGLLAWLSFGIIAHPFVTKRQGKQAEPQTER